MDAEAAKRGSRQQMKGRCFAMEILHGANGWLVLGLAAGLKHLSWSSPPCHAWQDFRPI